LGATLNPTRLIPSKVNADVVDEAGIILPPGGTLRCHGRL
jgi:hypothetical protein